MNSEARRRGTTRCFGATGSTKEAVQLDLRKGHWLQQASAELEDALKGSLSKAEACEVELQWVKKQQEERTRELQEKLQATNDKMNQAIASKQWQDMRIADLEQVKDQLMQKLDLETRRRDEAEAKCDVLLNGLKQANDQVLHVELFVFASSLTELRTERADAFQEMEIRVKELQFRESEMDQILATLENTTSQLETHRVMNSTLMKKKEEVEWQCLEAQAERDRLRQQLRSLIKS